MAGRPRKPTALHVVQGTHRADRHGELGTEPEDKPVSDLKPPKWLQADGRKVWRELAPIALEMGVLTESGRELFAHACSQLAVARKQQSSDAPKSLDMAFKILGQFGFTPSMKAKLAVNPKKADPLGEFLKGAK